MAPLVLGLGRALIQASLIAGWRVELGPIESLHICFVVVLRRFSAVWLHLNCATRQGLVESNSEPAFFI